MSKELWVEAATCRSIGTSVFYPEIGETWTEAIKVCQTSCPVRLQCLDYAMRCEIGAAVQQRHGVYGGLKPYARRKLEAEWLAGQGEAA